MSPRSDIDRTIDYYNLSAEDYAEQTINIRMESLYDVFLAGIPSGGRILDAGCGSGRDTKAFAALGYDVVAIDASEAMVKAAARLTNREVHLLRVQGLDYHDEFDGIWACASLLHVPRSEINLVIDKLMEALKPGGVCYMSFKNGDVEQLVEERFFNNYTENSLGTLLARHPGLETIRVWATEDERRTKKLDTWVNALVRKKEEK